MPSATRGQPAPRDPSAVFLAYLDELPLAPWLAATRKRQHIPNRKEAEVALESIVRSLPDQGRVLATRHGVLEALQRFESVEGRYLTRLRRASEHLRPATEQAALAVLVRPDLSAGQFAVLYEPFEMLVPAVILFGLP